MNGACGIRRPGCFIDAVVRRPGAQGHTFTPVQQQICCLNDSARTKRLEHGFFIFFFYSVVNESYIISSNDQVAVFWKMSSFENVHFYESFHFLTSEPRLCIISSARLEVQRWLLSVQVLTQRSAWWWTAATTWWSLELHSPWHHYYSDTSQWCQQQGKTSRIIWVGAIPLKWFKAWVVLSVMLLKKVQLR